MPLFGMVKCSDNAILQHDCAAIEVIIATFKVDKMFPQDKDLAAEQAKQENLKPLMVWLKDGILPSEDKTAVSVVKESENYCLLGDSKVLARISVIKEATVIRCVVPENLQRLACALFHDTIWAGMHRL